MSREAILAAGGFDENYLYPYEDADLCVAVIKAGYRLFHHPKALVHHFPAPSHNRRSVYDPGYFACTRHQIVFRLEVLQADELGVCAGHRPGEEVLGPRVHPDGPARWG